ncbi:unnamed protein product [Cyprideis torosa]|uniref:Uncharacterized protein n=1 Tax=Cyprideis torosa TaxID=163714 RepID=A0A7R8W6T1_9CRUS|nr:unnamed protein product [Cyprideis torosa]CAG0886865.1 unnamed protein product [Cyprideis torosa]
MPPGPWGLPILGYLPFMDSVRPQYTLQKLRDQYGHIFSINIVQGRSIIYLCDPELINEAFNMPEFLPRPESFLFHVGLGGGGLLANEGQVWMDNRRFTLKALRDFGFGKKTLNDTAMNDVLQVVDCFRRKLGKPTDVGADLNIAIISTLWKLVANVEWTHDNPEYHKLFEEMTGSFDSAAKIPTVMFHAWTEPLTFWKSGKEALACIYKFIDHFTAIFRNEVESHKQQSHSISNDYIDSYLKEIERLKLHGKEHPSINEKQLYLNIRSLFLAGSETTSTTIRWALYFLIENPEIQQRCFEEIEKVIGLHRNPHMDDRGTLPYTEAFIKEVNRCCNVLPFGVFHAVRQDVWFKGYLFPKGSWVIGNQYSCHMDPKYFSNPSKFDPTRFLDEEGKLRKTVPGYIPFGSGKRQCLGESLAKIELFLFITTLIQQFKFLKPEKCYHKYAECPPSVALVNHPPPFSLIIQNRE